MLVLGIDCGTERTGYGVIDSDGKRHRMVSAGTIVTRPRDPLAKRLLEISRGLRQVIQQHRPECAAVEEVFYAVNVRSSMQLAHARGVALLAIAEAGLPLGEYSPTAIKSSVAGFGRADKKQIQYMVQSLLNLDEAIASEDASDAVAVAICHATHLATATRIAGVSG